MSPILVRYVARAVLAASGLVLAVLAGLVALFGLVGEAADIGKGGYGLGEAVLYVLMVLPSQLVPLVPSAGLIGVLLGLGGLAARSELTAMRAAGFSVAGIVGAVLAGGLVLVGAAAAVDELAGAPARQLAEARRAALRGEQLSLGTRYGLWMRDGARILHARHAASPERLLGVELLELGPERRLVRIARAREARYDAARGAWLLLEVRETRLTADGTVRTARHGRLLTQVRVAPGLVRALAVEPWELTLRGLRDYVAYLRGNGLDARPYELAFWLKVLAPLSGLAMMALGVPFVLGPLRRRGAGARLFAGALAGIAFLIVLRAANHAALAYGLPPALAAAAPLALVAAAGAWALARVR